jgi:hypothetical protein
MTTLRIAAVAAALSAALPAQWLNHPTPGIPRTKDGKPNLTAPAPRTPDKKPDLSGLWRPRGGTYMLDATAGLKPEEIQPWAAALLKQRGDDERESPIVRCLPYGPVYSYLEGLHVIKLVQTPSLIVTLNEPPGHRQIFLDGRELPKDPNPSWMGYSVGRWEGDTLVVETTGYNEGVWLDLSGHPLSEGMRITERFHRRDFGHMDVAITFNDPKAYKRPWTIHVEWEIAPDTEMLEYVCAENEKDRSHMVGKPSDELSKAVKVPQEVLARYVGVYEMPNPEDPSVTVPVHVTLPGDTLMISYGGRGQMPSAPLSETVFFGGLGGTVEFFQNERGEVAHLIMRAVEGDFKAVRRK